MSVPKAIQWWKGAGGSKVEEGRENEEEEQENQKKENVLINAILLGEPRETDAAEAGVNQRAAREGKSTEARARSWAEGLGERSPSGLKQKWGCSRVEHDFGEGDLVD